MGVKGLWRLLLPIGRRISIETLEGQVLAIDASIWLTQFLTVAAARREEDLRNDASLSAPAAISKAYSYDYLVGFLRRICKLRYQGVRPVFVFDGATPEIKQRELRDRRKRQKRKRESFLGGVGDDDDGEEGVRRMAKRILVQQLKTTGGGKPTLVTSSKKIEAENSTVINDRFGHDISSTGIQDGGTATTNASYAPGFYDPESIAEAEALMKDDTPGRTVQPDEQPKSLENGSANRSGSVAASSDEPDIIALLDDDDYLREATPEDGDNDWDVGVIARKGDLRDSDEDTSILDRKRKGKRFSKTKTSNVFISTGEFHAGDGTNFEVKAVASLAAIQRKDVVEDAQKNRRLQSRREFLKVASDPEGLSQCQLRNFLKSTKLNRDISQMAKFAAQRDENNDDDEDDDRRADTSKAYSSSRRRVTKVFFEKDSEKGKSTTKSKELELKRFRKKKLSLLNIDDKANSEESASDDGQSSDVVTDVDSENGIGVEYHFSAGQHYANDGNESTGDDESIENNLVQENHQESGGGFLTAATSSLNHEPKAHGTVVRFAPRSRRIRIQEESDSDEVEDVKLPAKDDATIAQELQDESLAIALQQAEDEDEEDGMNDRMLDGGFLQNLKYKRGIEAIVDINDSHDDEPLSQSGNSDSHETGKNELRVDQVREDARLAASLQGIEYEDDPSASFVLSATAQGEGTGKHSSGDTPGSIIKGAIRLDESCFSTRRQDVSADIVVDEDNEEEDEDLSLEEGDDRALAKNEAIQKRSLDQANQTGGTNRDECRFAAAVEHNRSISSNEDDEDVDWEDASLDDERNRDAESPPVPTAKSPVGGGSDVGIIELIQDEDPTIHFSRFHEGDWGQPSPSKAKSSKSSKEMEEALAHAQATAANLTNWAGRAFRRAVAQHAEENGMEIPEIAKPKALGDDVYSNHDVQPTDVPIQKQRTSSITVFDSLNLRPDEGNQSQPDHRRFTQSANKAAVDNSKWFGELDTTALASESYNTSDQQQVIEREIGMDTSSGGVTEEMRAEVMQLLRLFGVPYVVAPAEAEAQCVMLEQLKLVDGIVTEDSDAFVFGGQVIYKNIFDDQKYVEVYHSKDASEEMNLNRDALVALAMLLGGDYTEGVKGVGIVNGMEVLQAFDVAKDCKAGLARFRQWLDGFDPLGIAKQKSNGTDENDECAALTKEEIFHKKHQSARTRWVAPKTFPDIKVLTAYLNPVVDASRERFSWGVPDIDQLVEFCRKQMGWTPDETKKLVVPVIKQMEESTMRQTRIDSFMRYEDGIKFASIRSKRLRDVLESTSTSSDSRNKEGSSRSKSNKDTKHA